MVSPSTRWPCCTGCAVQSFATGFQGSGHDEAVAKTVLVAGLYCQAVLVELNDRVNSQQRAQGHIQIGVDLFSC